MFWQRCQISQWSRKREFDKVGLRHRQLEFADAESEIKKSLVMRYFGDVRFPFWANYMAAIGQ